MSAQREQMGAFVRGVLGASEAGTTLEPSSGPL